MAGIDSMTLWTAMDALRVNPDVVPLYSLNTKQLETLCQFYPLKKHGLPRFLFSGSTAEGTADFLSDFDIMHLLWDFDVTATWSLTPKQSPGDRCQLLFRDDKADAGFALLEVLTEEAKENKLVYEGFSFVTKHQGMHLLSADKCRRAFTHFKPYEQEMKGPSIRGTGGQPLDEVPCVKCFFWPKQAQEWQTRVRHYNWPPPELIAKAINNGILLVPTGASGSANEEHEWRISFSELERELIWSWNNTQLKCYLFLKQVAKQMISRIVPDVLTSYHLKTLMFWQIESTRPEMWTPGNMAECITELLNNLLSCVREANCPHYFIRTNNLFQSKLDISKKTKLVSAFKVILGKGLMYCIGKCPQLARWYKDTQENALDRPNFTLAVAASVLKEGCYFNLVVQRFIINALSGGTLSETIKSHQQCVRHYIVQFRKHPIRVKKVLKAMRNTVHTSLGSHLLSQALETNDKNIRDILLAKALYNLESGENGNALEAKLKLAMFYYIIGHYSETLDIIFQAVDGLTAGYVLLANKAESAKEEETSIGTDEVAPKENVAKSESESLTEQNGNDRESAANENQSPSDVSNGNEVEMKCDHATPEVSSSSIVGDKDGPKQTQPLTESDKTANEEQATVSKDCSNNESGESTADGTEKEESEQNKSQTDTTENTDHQPGEACTNTVPGESAATAKSDNIANGESLPKTTSKTAVGEENNNVSGDTSHQVKSKSPEKSGETTAESAEPESSSGKDGSDENDSVQNSVEKETTHPTTSRDPLNSAEANKKRSKDLELTFNNTVDKFYHGAFVMSKEDIRDSVTSLKYYVGDIHFNSQELCNLPIPFRFDINSKNTGKQEDLPNKPLVLEGITYYYFLQFMCFHALKNTDEMKRTLEDFQGFMKLREKSFRYPENHNLLAQCYLLAGDMLPALKVLWKSLQLDSNLNSNAALWLLGAHLYKQSELLGVSA